MVKGAGPRSSNPVFEPCRGVFQLSVALPSTVAAGCPQQWSSGHLALEERAEASPPLPVTGSIACAPALESVSVSSLLGAAFNWGRWLPSTVVVLPPGPGRTVAGDRFVFASTARWRVDAEQSTMRKSELRSFIWRAEADAVLTAREACFGLRRQVPA